MYLTSILYFDVVSWVQKGFVEMFAGLRSSVLKNLNFVPIATAFAAIFVIIKLIRIVSEIEGDDQAGGFGHVKLWEIIRPIVFFMLVLGSPKAVNLIDGSVKHVTESISNSLHYKNPFFDNETTWDDYYNPVKEATHLKFQEAKKKAIWDRIGDQLSAVGYWFDGTMAAIKRFFTTSLINIVVFIMQILLSVVGALMLGIASINLMLITLFAPFMFSLSILEPWKHNYQKLIANFVYFELWYPIIGIINFFYGAATDQIRSFIYNSKLTQSSFQTAAAMGQETLVLIVETVFMAICISLLFSVPSIANKVIVMGATSSGDENTIGSMAKSFVGLFK